MWGGGAGTAKSLSSPSLVMIPLSVSIIEQKIIILDSDKCLSKDHKQSDGVKRVTGESNEHSSH